ncbi:MAG: hypothetical protein ACRD2G_20020 [Terriglobia bacterium]
MKKLMIALAAIVLALGPLAPASFSQIELYGGYSYLRVGTGNTSAQNGSGWEAALSTHLLGPFGLEADYSNHYGLSPLSITHKFGLGGSGPL